MVEEEEEAKWTITSSDEETGSSKRSSRYHLRETEREKFY